MINEFLTVCSTSSDLLMSYPQSNYGQQVVFRGSASSGDAGLQGGFTITATVVNTPLQNGRIMREFFFPATPGNITTSAATNYLDMDSPALTPSNPIYPLPLCTSEFPVATISRGGLYTPSDSARISSAGGGGVGAAFTHIILQTTASSSKLNAFSLIAFYNY